MVKQSSRTKTKNRKTALFIVAVVFLVALFVVLKATHVLFPTPATTIGNTKTGSETTKGEPIADGNNQAATGTNNETGSGPVSKNGDTTVEPTKELLDPTGTFVSNHHVSLSDPDQLNVQSNCTTTPKASCFIRFTNGTITKTLPPATTDAGGAAYWTWNVKDLGLTAGKWKIVMVASMGSSSKTSTDALSLEVTK